MRSIGDIVKQFPLERIALDKGVLQNKLIPNDDKLTKALAYLGIDLNDFERIPFQADRKKYLRYKYLLLNFELYNAPFHSQCELLAAYQELAECAYQLLIHTEILSQPDKYSAFSKGLSALYQRSNYTPKHIQTENLGESIFAIVDKRGGIEPGYEASLHEDLLLYLDEKFQGDIAQMRAYIDQHHGDINTIQARHAEDIPHYMFKLDYHAKDKSGKVYLSEKDVRRTGTVKKATTTGKYCGDVVTKVMVQSKSGPYRDKNKEALLEALATDIAGLFMPTAPQQLVKTAHQSDGSMLKLLLKSKILEDASSLGPLVGGEGVNSYCGRRLIISRKGIQTVSDDRLTNAASIYLPLIATGDYDKVGSDGGNLLRKLLKIDYHSGRAIYQIIGIDFGHPGRKKNPIIETLLQDGRYRQPRTHPFKNFSALSDAPLSELIKGALILAKMGGVNINPEILNAYQADIEFINLINTLNPEEVPIIIQNYQTALRDLSEYEIQHQQDSQLLSQAVSEVHKTLKQTLKSINSLFNHLITHSPKVIDLADNLKKLCAAMERKTTLRSSDGTHGLKHLLLTDKAYSIFWDIELNETHYSFSAQFKKNPALMFSALEKWIGKNNNHIKINLSAAGEITIICPLAHLEEAVALFAEEKIKQHFHAQDHAAIEAAYQELQLQDLLLAPWFQEKNITLQLKIAPTNETRYQLMIITDEKTDALLKNLIHALPHQIAMGNTSFIEFPADDLKTIYQSLISVQSEYKIVYEESLECERLLEENFLNLQKIEEIKAQDQKEEFEIIQQRMNEVAPKLRPFVDLQLSSAGKTQAPIILTISGETAFLKHFNWPHEGVSRFQGEKFSLQYTFKIEEFPISTLFEALDSAYLKINRVAEPPKLIRATPIQFFQPPPPLIEPDPLVIIEQEKADTLLKNLLDKLKQYKTFLTPPLNTSATWAEWLQPAKQLYNFYSNPSSSAALIYAIENFSEKFSAAFYSSNQDIHSLIQGFTSIIYERKKFIEERKGEHLLEELEILQDVIKSLSFMAMNDESVNSLHQQPK